MTKQARIILAALEGASPEIWEAAAKIVTIYTKKSAEGIAILESTDVSNLSYCERLALVDRAYQCIG